MPIRPAIRPAALGLALALGACTVGPAPVPTPPLPPENACGAAELQHLVGQPRQVLASMKFSQPVRVIPPGTAVTMDFSPARLNFEIDARDRIARVFCG